MGSGLWKSVINFSTSLYVKTRYKVALCKATASHLSCASSSSASLTYNAQKAECMRSSLQNCTQEQQRTFLLGRSMNITRSPQYKCVGNHNKHVLSKSTVCNPILNKLMMQCLRTRGGNVLLQRVSTNALYVHTRAASNKHDYGLVTEGLPELDEKELEEKAVLGSGPGGQAVNKTHNACQLKHIPTGITVKSHYTRSYELNRKRARLLLRQKLDRHYHGEEGVMARADREASTKQAKKKRRDAERREKMKEFREREGISE